MHGKSLVAALALVVLWLGGALAALAQDYPNRPITLVLGFPPGTASDNSARFVARGLQERLKQPVVVENRPGALGVIGAQSVARAAPDGYTLLQGSNSYTSTFFKSPPMDFSKELTPISMINEGVFFLYVTPSLPVRSLAELVDYAKANPGKLNSGFTNVLGQLSTESFRSRAAIDVPRIPYKAEAAMQQALISGEIHIVVSSYGAYKGPVEAGKIRVLATMGQSRQSFRPDVATMEELGFKGVVAQYSNGLWAPAATPRAVIDRISKAMIDLGSTPEAKDFYRNVTATEARGTTPEAYQRAIEAEHRFWAATAKAANYQPE